MGFVLSICYTTRWTVRFHLPPTFRRGFAYPQMQEAPLRFAKGLAWQTRMEPASCQNLFAPNWRMKILFAVCTRSC